MGKSSDSKKVEELMKTLEEMRNLKDKVQRDNKDLWDFITIFMREVCGILLESQSIYLMGFYPVVKGKFISRVVDPAINIDIHANGFIDVYLSDRVKSRIQEAVVETDTFRHMFESSVRSINEINKVLEDIVFTDEGEIFMRFRAYPQVGDIIEGTVQIFDSLLKAITDEVIKTVANKNLLEGIVLNFMIEGTGGQDK